MVFQFLESFFLNNLNNCLFDQYIQKNNQNNIIAGIDEAGRGPVLGPLVYSLATTPVIYLDNLSSIGFKDSKKLTAETRTKLFNHMNKKLLNDVSWAVNIISPNFISNSMLKRTKYNLNDLSHDAIISLLNSFVSKNFIYEVVRDKIIQQWKFFEDNLQLSVTPLQYGSGYPSDPLTKNYMKNNPDVVFGYPTFVRFSWSTAMNILNSHLLCCKIMWEDTEEDDNNINEKKRSKVVHSNTRISSNGANKKFKTKDHNQMEIKNYFMKVNSKCGNDESIIKELFPSLEFFYYL
ncbi:ribonuclease H2 subunit A-like isoform X6 [Gordionus sp. m RMFG-2023]|uniref:ribonuclease H2 subunit A-like isoform X6 n=1 Tax=Gordionus sp. m RMFG-2023 TaxID=3053472 RepID=UPI0031FC3B2E